MKSTYLFLFCLLAAISLQSQNTVVQTLTLEDNATSGDFTFPDDPNASWEKIWMVYQMRCHEAQVGSGAVGCREWDYSCNTFITDPTHTDSSVAFHPSHIIPGFTGDAFEISNTPTYTYTAYNQQEMVHGEVISMNTSTVGSGTIPLPLSTELEYSKTQILFTASELTAAGLTAGDISDLSMEILDDEDAIHFFKIKIKATSKTELDANNPDLHGFTEVYFRDTDFPGIGNYQFDFHNTFDWDGTSNLIVEMSFSSPQSGAGNTVAGDVTVDNSLIYTQQTDNHLEFSGAGKIDYDISNLEGISSEITVSFWSKGDEDALPDNTTILEAFDENDQRTINIHLPWGNGQIYWDCGNAGGSYDRINKTANASDFAGQWSHWAFTKNANTGSMKIYLNGQLWHSGTGKTLPIDIFEFSVGTNVPGNRFFPGEFDEFRVWKKELSIEAINDWMNKSINADHPNYEDLVSYLPLDQNTGNTIIDMAPSAPSHDHTGVAVWRNKKGEDYFKHFVVGNGRPNISFHQNSYMNDMINEIQVIDSTENPQFAIYNYAVDGSDLVQTTTDFHWQAGYQYVSDQAGAILDSVNFEADGTIDIDELIYYNKIDSKYEILSFVTPYGNGLDLGPEGKTWWIDVTDYAPILKGERRLSVEMGGQNQEELDIKFVFVPGTPAREVKDIRNIWPFGRGWFDPILNDRVFEPRNIPVANDAEYVKIRSAITGHGQNGEFLSRNHYINVNGGDAEFNYDVWKECGQNPVYPQGGTWTFDRAGWCPGMATDVHEFDITNMVSPGGDFSVDYGINGDFMTEANYLVSNQLVTYGAINFSVDPELVDIKRPTDRVAHARFNPHCDDPAVIIKNRGAETLASLVIKYHVEGGTELEYTWTGNLAFDESTEVILPIENLSFWNSSSDEGIFHASISAPNGVEDEYSANNSLSSTFEKVQSFAEAGLEMELRTNNRPQENKLTITDGAGQILAELDDLSAATTYTQEIDFPEGCYSVILEDTGDDGLYYWYWAQVGQNVGAGSLRITFALTPTIQVPIKAFEPEFGGDLHYSFVIPGTVSNENLTELRKFSFFSNPTNDGFQLELDGLVSKEATLQIISETGSILMNRQLELFSGQVNEYVDISNLSAGIYNVRVVSAEKVWVKPVVKLN